MILNIPATLYVCVMLSPRRLILEYDTEMPSPKSTWRLVDSESPYRKKANKTGIFYGFACKGFETGSQTVVNRWQVVGLKKRNRSKYIKL